MKVIFLLVPFFILTANLYGQKKYLHEIDSLNQQLVSASDTEKLEILDQLVEKYFFVNENKKMHQTLQDLEQLSEKLHSIKSQFKIAYHQGLIAYHKEWRPKEGIKYLHQSLRIGKKNNIDDPKAYSVLYNNLGLIYKNTLQYDSALYYFNESASVNERYHLYSRNIPLFLNLGHLYQFLGNTNMHLTYAQKCLETAIKLNDDLALCTGYKAVAEALCYNGSADLAREYCKKALILSKKVYGSEHTNTALLMDLLSKCYYRIGNYHKALHFAQQCNHSLQSIYGVIHPKLCYSYISLGTSYSKLNKIDSAEYFNLKAMRCAKMIPNNNVVLILTLINLGHYYLGVDNTEESMKYLHMVLKEKKLNARQKAEALLLLGDVQNKMKDYAECLKTYQKAITTRLDIASTSKYRNPSAQLLSQDPRELAIISRKANIYETLYSTELNKSYMLSAMADYLLCDTLINSFRNQFINEEDKLILNNSAVLALGEDLRGRITLYNSMISGGNPNDNKGDAENKLFDAKRKYEKYLKDLEVKFPRYYQLKYGNHFLSLPEVQQKLNGRVLLEYVSTEESIYTFLIKDQTYKVIKIDKPKELKGWIHDFRSAILEKDYESYEKLGYQLYKTLFEPIKSYLKKEDQIIIVPDGSLWYVNFDLLLQQPASGKPFYELPYLIRDYTISYANSANHFFINDNLPQNNTSNKCLAFSYSNTSAPESSSIDFSVLRNMKGDLPGTRKEIRNISKLLPGEYFFGRGASEANFKKESHKYAILHLALHGEIDDENPLYSKLHFSPTARDTTEDGDLNTYEIYNMSLNSQLAVLSACNTGYGKLEKGEGLMSLGRAFQYAGVNSLLLTKWEVSDEEAPAIMYNFYKNLKEGMGKSEALRKAKLDYLKTAGMYKSAPFYWGSYVVLGNTCPIQIEAANSTYWTYLIISACILGIIAWLTYRRLIFKRSIAIETGKSQKG